MSEPLPVPTPTPSSKSPTQAITVGGVAGALTTVIVWVLTLFGVTMPGEVAAAVTTILSFFAAWITHASTTTS